MTVTEAVREQRERDGRDGRDGDGDRGDGERGGGDEPHGPDPSKPVRRAFGVVSRRPVLLFAFALAAVVVAVADVARILDPVGNATPNVIGGGVSFSFLTYPTGTRVTMVAPGALVGLQPWWLLATVVLGAVGPLAAGAATTWTVARAANREVTTDRVLATTTYVVAAAAAWYASVWLVEVLPEVVAPLLLVGLWLSARLFPAPALAALDRSPLDAASEAYALTRGRALGCALSVLGAGTLASILADVGSVAAISQSDPLFAVGTALSYTFAGTVGAVAATIYAIEAREEREQYREDREQRSSEREDREQQRKAREDRERQRGEREGRADDGKRRNGN